MTAFRMACAAVALALVAGQALSQPAPMQPPMNDFDQAFYRCDGGEAFMMTYDDEHPTQAEMVTNSDQRHYKLKRAEAKSGVEFSGGGAKFWTDGKTVSGETPKAAFKNCKIKTS
jgi:membrane-bound inhibitor of C-type lysozyme